MVRRLGWKRGPQGTESEIVGRENLIRDEAFQFAIKIIRLARGLREQREYDLASQIWRAGTGIGANVEEAQAAQSRADFISKMSIASKEAREAQYWLRLAQEGGILPEAETAMLREDCEKLVRILTSIVKTTSGGSKEIENPKSRIQNPSPMRGN
ncbi:MAG: four helix bundle protein [Verrucomicrobia bacterium]|nr:four helix bundle protein [Verrucomicrobiota bacterium]